MTEVVPFEKEAVKSYLDVCITTWRKRVQDAKNDKDFGSEQMAISYVDAYQSIRVSLFSELLAHPDVGESMEEAVKEWSGGDSRATIPLPNSGTIGNPNR